MKAIATLLSTVILITSLASCAWWQKNGSTFTSVEMCLVNELAAGAISDPMLLVSGCAGATLTTLETLLGNLISNALPATDAGVSAQLSPYVLHLIQVKQHTDKLLAAGVK